MRSVFIRVSVAKTRDRLAGLAHRAVRGREVLRRLVLRQRVVRHAGVDDRLHAIADLDRREHGAARLRAPARRSAGTSSRCSARRRRAARACPPSRARRSSRSVKPSSPRLLNGAKLHGGCVSARRPSSRPASVCASSAPPMTGPATTSVCSSRSPGSTSSRSCASRQIVDGMAEQLVRVQVDAPVEAVAVVEVPVAHQHFELLRAVFSACRRNSSFDSCSTRKRLSVAGTRPSRRRWSRDGPLELPAVERRVLRFRPAAPPRGS